MPIRTIISDDMLPARGSRARVSPDLGAPQPFWASYRARLDELHHKIAAAVRAGLLGDALRYELELDLHILMDGVPGDRLGRTRRS